MKVEEESEKVGLKLSIQKTKIMASSPITSWEIDEETEESEDELTGQRRKAVFVSVPFSRQVVSNCLRPHWTTAYQAFLVYWVSDSV